MSDVPSRSAVDRAGEIMRGYQRGELVAPDAHRHALETMFAWRRGYTDPLAKTVMGLRSILSTATGLTPQGRVGQRLKRQDRIADKLVRMPTTRLTQIEDIAGCRLLIDDERQLRALEERICDLWSIKTREDYLAEPKTSGYRAVHLVARRDERLVEIQLRVPEHHAWAELVDGIALLGGPLAGVKDGRGPAALLDALRALADALDDLRRGAGDPARIREVERLVDLEIDRVLRP